MLRFVLNGRCYDCGGANAARWAQTDRMEQQPAEFYEQVREGYRQLAAHEPGRIVLIDGSREASETGEGNLGNEFLCDSPRSATNRQSAIGQFAILRWPSRVHTALEFLRRAYEQNRLAHAYLITGTARHREGTARRGGGESG